MKRIMCTGPESNGTKMLAGLLERAGADVDHVSPNYRIWDGRPFPKPADYDAVVIISRDGYCAARSAIEAGHVPLGADPGEEKLMQRARVMQLTGFLKILGSLEDELQNVFWVNYGDIVGKDRRYLNRLLSDLGLSDWIDTRDVGDADAKYLGGEWFRDQRESFDR